MFFDIERTRVDFNAENSHYWTYPCPQAAQGKYKQLGNKLMRDQEIAQQQGNTLTPVIATEGYRK
jgi:hypothetical protein